MEPTREELLSALQDVEEFLSVTLVNESLTTKAQMRRQQLEERLKNLTLQTKAGFDDGGQEVYDDVRDDDINDGVLIVQGVPQDSTEDDIPQDIYDDTVPEATQEIYDDTVPETSQEIYDDTVPEATQEIYDDTVPGTQADGTELYEVAEPSKAAPGTTARTVDMDSEVQYEVEGVTDDDKSMDSLDSRERSATHELESLTKPIKPEDVDGILLTGYLDKHRKKGLYIGSKWQKRFCVIRSFAMYYYTSPNAIAQKGTIILPGYTVARSNKNNKEFTLTKAEDRTYTFMVKSAEEIDKWIDVITQAANCNAISKRQSEILERLRSFGEGEEDTSSICADDGGNSNSHLDSTSVNDELGECYDDVGQEQQSHDTTPQPACPSQPAALPSDDEQETYDDVGASPPPQPERLSKPAPSPPEEGEGEMYDDVGSSPPPQPVRPPKPAAVQPPVETEQETYDDVGISPPPPPLSLEPVRPNKAVPVLPTSNDSEEEELYDDVGLEASPPPPPQPERPKRPVSEIKPTTEEEEEELYDDVGSEAQPEVVAVVSKPPLPGRTLPQVPINDSKPSPPLAPKIPLPPTPDAAPKPTIPPRIPSQEIQRNGMQEPAPLTPPQETKIFNKAPPPPLPEDNPVSKAPPPPPPEETEEEEKQEIEYDCIYQALWDCKPDADDELEFCRGDLLSIYEKPHADWWIGSKFKPQGYETRLIPTNYLIQAYDL